MTCQKFEDALDELLASSFEDAGVISRLPPEMSEHVQRCQRCRQLCSDWLWLHGQVQRWPVESVSEGFADRVVANLHTPTRTLKRERNDARPAAVVASLAAALAICVLLTLFLLPSDHGSGTDNRPSIAQSANSENELAPVDDTVKSLVRDVTNALALATEAETTDIAPAKNDEPEALASDADALPNLGLGKTLRDSTENLLTTGKQLGTTIQPITKSAVGAFSFLWPEVGNEEKPRT